jgi:uncharacterized membrane protein YkvA (DUF1232 family)
MLRLLRALPALFVMIARLVRDPALPRAAKFALAAAAVYLASPIDLVPDFIPFIGYLDDVLLAAILLDGVLNYVDRDLVVRHWPGSARSLDALARTARLLSAWVPRRVKARIFSTKP